MTQLVSRHVSGVLLVPVDSVRTDLTPLTEAGIPVVLADRWIDGADTDLVATDNLDAGRQADRKSTRLNSSHVAISYAVFCLKKKTKSINSISTHTLLRFLHRAYMS